MEEPARSVVKRRLMMAKGEIARAHTEHELKECHDDKLT